MKTTLFIVLVILASPLVKAQYKYRVKEPTEFFKCNQSICSKQCCSTYSSFELDKWTIKSYPESCRDSGRRLFHYSNPDSPDLCIATEGDHVGLFREVRPKLLYFDVGFSYDQVSEDSQEEGFGHMNFFVGYFKPLFPIFKSLYATVGARTGLSLRTETSEFDIGLLKSEAVAGFYHSKSGFQVTVGLGATPYRVVEGGLDRISRNHVSLTASIAM